MSNKLARGFQRARSTGKLSALRPVQSRALFEVAHYNRVYGKPRKPAPASGADIEYELGATKSTDKALVEAIERGERRGAEKALDTLVQLELVTMVHGGYEITAKGKRVLGPGWIQRSKQKVIRDYGSEKY